MALFGRKQVDNELLQAAENWDFCKMAESLRFGADVNAKDERGATALHYTAMSLDSGALQSLISRGANVNSTDKHGLTPLFFAAFTGRIENVRVLISAGADVNSRSKDDDDGTPLTGAADKGHSKIVQMLIASGADINARGPKGTTALFLAVQNGHLETFRILLKAGADVAAAKRYGDWNIVDMAYLHEWELIQNSPGSTGREIIKLLEEAGYTLENRSG